MNKSESIKELAAALSIAQASFPHIPKDKTVKVKTDKGNYEFKYAPLESILSAIRPVLKDQGLAFIQSVSGDSLSTTILHKSGEWLQSDAIPVRSQSTKAQELGSAITYAKRYSLCAMLGIVADDDDDGNGADGNQVETKKAAKVEGKGSISPTDGALAVLTTTEQSLAKSIANAIVDLWGEDKKFAAYEAFYESGHGNEIKLAVWEILKPHSSIRNELKKMHKQPEAA